MHADLRGRMDLAETDGRYCLYSAGPAQGAGTGGVDVHRCRGEEPRRPPGSARRRPDTLSVNDRGVGIISQHVAVTAGAHSLVIDGTTGVTAAGGMTATGGMTVTGGAEVSGDLKVTGGVSVTSGMSVTGGSSWMRPMPSSSEATPS